MNEQRVGADGLRRLRFAAALAHAVPAVTLAIDCDDGSTLTVSRCRLAPIDPCRFRSLVLHDLQEPRRPGVPRFSDSVTGVRMTSGPEHLGAGIYRYRDQRGEQRWFLTELGQEAVGDLLADCPVEGSEHSVTATARPDSQLRITAVRLDAAHPAAVLDLDQVAWRAVSAALVAELAADCRDACR